MVIRFIYTVVGILCHYVNCKDWKTAFLNVIPRRKGISAIDEDVDAAEKHVVEEQKEKSEKKGGSICCLQ